MAVGLSVAICDIFSVKELIEMAPLDRSL